MKRTHVLDELGKWRVMWDAWSGACGLVAEFVEYERAKSVADQLNKERPKMWHWVEQVTTPAPAGQQPTEAGNP